MKITKDNYFQHIKRIGFENLPLVLKQSHLVIMTKTDNGEDWKLYQSDKDLKRMVDLAFEKLKEFIESRFKNGKGLEGLDGAPKIIHREQALSAAREVLRHFLDAQYTFDALLRLSKEFKLGQAQGSIADGHIRLDKIGNLDCTFIFNLRELKESGSDQKAAKQQVPVSEFKAERKYINAVLRLDGKRVSKKELDELITALQTSIEKQELTKKSPLRKEINFIQALLVDVYNGLKVKSTEVKLRPETREKLLAAVKKLNALKADRSNTSTGMQHKPSADELFGSDGFASDSTEEQARKFLTGLLSWQNVELKKSMVTVFIQLIEDWQAEKASKKSVVWNEVELARHTLNTFRHRMTMDSFLQLSPQTEEAVRKGIAKLSDSKTGLQGLKAEEPATAAKPNAVVTTSTANPAASIISSNAFVEMDFPVIGFTGKWLAFIGNPSPGFKVAVSGMPKMGKTYLCIDFANYLSLNHGKVLYVSKEEYPSPTLQLKLKEKNVGNENLDVSGSIPSDLSQYKFIFLDSISRLKLSADDLRALEAANPGKSFIYVFQVTKAGKARGTNEFMHNVDIIIEVPEKGKAIQFGRYNQGGAMDIFSDMDKQTNTPAQQVLPANAPALSGLDAPEPEQVTASAETDSETETGNLAGPGKKSSDIKKEWPPAMQQTGSRFSYVVEDYPFGNYVILYRGNTKKVELSPLDLFHINRLKTGQTYSFYEYNRNYYTVTNRGERYTIIGRGEKDGGYFIFDTPIPAYPESHLRETADINNQLLSKIDALADLVKDYTSNKPAGTAARGLNKLADTVATVFLKRNAVAVPVLSSDDKQGLNAFAQEITAMLKDVRVLVAEKAESGQLQALKSWLSLLESELTSLRATPAAKSSGMVNVQDLGLLKTVFEDNQGRAFLDEDFTAIFEIASSQERDFFKSTKKLHENLEGYLRSMERALMKWENDTLAGRAGNDAKNTKVEALFERLKTAIKNLERVNTTLYKSKQANWGDVATLCSIHDNLGQRLHDGYEGAQGYSKSLEEGLNRHYTANQHLLKEALQKMKVYAKKNHYAEMLDWYNFLAEELERFTYIFRRTDEADANTNLHHKTKRNPSPGMTIETEFSVPLDNLSALLSNKGNFKALLNKLDESPLTVEKAVHKLAEAEIKTNQAHVRLVSVKYKDCDANAPENGFAYFAAILTGSPSELRQVAGKDELFYFNWEA